MTARLCVIEGDGIGREVVPVAVRLLRILLPDLEVVSAEGGWGCFQRRGVSIPAETLAKARECGAVLFGAVASPARKVPGYRSAIVTLRNELDTYANLRPVRGLPLPGSRADVDLLIVRENTEGLYVGEEEGDENRAVAQRVITRSASRRVARRAYELARSAGRRRVTIAHKANILPLTCGLFRDTVRQVARDYPEIETDEMLVDALAYRLVRDPESFAVILTTNLFGDILSDITAAWCGGLGMAPSVNLGDSVVLAEPVHGAAPDIAGKGIANPLATILSAALLLRFAWHEPALAASLEQAVSQALRTGSRTPDLAGPGEQSVSTEEMADLVSQALDGMRKE